jgi:hypothetical protein
MQVDITGANTTTDTAASFQSTRKPDLDFSVPASAASAGSVTSSATPDLDFDTAATPAVLVGDSASDLDFATGTVAATAAELTGTGAADLDFTVFNYTATLAVDGGSVQNILLDALFADADDLVTELNLQTDDATWSQLAGVLTLTSDTAGASSELDWDGTAIGADIKVDDADESGDAEIPAYSATLAVDGGSPQDIVLDTLFANVAALLVSLNAQTADATWTESSGILTVTSDSVGDTSELELVLVTSVADLNITADDVFGSDDSEEYVTEITVDGGSPQTIVLNSVYVDIDDLITDLNAQTTGATWTTDVETGLYIVLTSDTTGASSQIITSIQAQGVANLHIADDTYDGEDAVSAFVATLAVDGGSPQDIELNTKFANLDELIIELNSQLAGATATPNSSFLVITSDTAGASSELELVITSESKSLYIEAQDTLGDSVTSTGTYLVMHSEGGSVDNPTVVTIQNVGPDPDDPFTGPVLEVSREEGLTFGNGIQIYAGATGSFTLISGDNLYATAADSTTVDARIDIAGR